MSSEQRKAVANRILRETKDGIDHPAYLVNLALKQTGDLSE